jgi:ClpP class serine protease
MAKKKATPKTITEKKEAPKLKMLDLIDPFWDCYAKENPSDEDKKFFNERLTAFLKQGIGSLEKGADYNILILYDNILMVKADSDRIYNAINSFEDKTKPILLVILSGGGEPASAYLIGKLCQEFCNGNFTVVVPRYAKSAATLLACAAHEIHMGSLSELGPIDPQIKGMPTLGLKNSIEHIAELVSNNTGSSEMFARYLQRTVEPIQIGYYERVAESAMQYAEKLLDKNKSKLPSTPKEIARRLVYGYKDHGFVIDKEEATEIFGKEVIKSNTPEYKIGNFVYDTLSRVERWATSLKQNFYFTGSLDSVPEIWPKPKK